MPESYPHYFIRDNGLTIELTRGQFEQILPRIEITQTKDSSIFIGLIRGYRARKVTIIGLRNLEEADRLIREWRLDFNNSLSVQDYTR